MGGSERGGEGTGGFGRAGGGERRRIATTNGGRGAGGGTSLLRGTPATRPWELGLSPLQRFPWRWDARIAFCYFSLCFFFLFFFSLIFDFLIISFLIVSSPRSAAPRLPPNMEAL